MKITKSITSVVLKLSCALKLLYPVIIWKINKFCISDQHITQRLLLCYVFIGPRECRSNVNDLMRGPLPLPLTIANTSLSLVLTSILLLNVNELPTPSQQWYCYYRFLDWNKNVDLRYIFTLYHFRVPAPKTLNTHKSRTLCGQNISVFRGLSNHDQSFQISSSRWRWEHSRIQVNKLHE
jgi:hypothetical protein